MTILPNPLTSVLTLSADANATAGDNIAPIAPALAVAPNSDDEFPHGFDAEQFLRDIMGQK